MKNTLSFILLFITSLLFSAVQDSIEVKKENGKVYVVHEVEKGETLWRLSQRYNVSVETIKKANGGGELKEGNVISILISEDESNTATSSGQQPRTHKVEKKETLYSIAKKYNISVTDLKKWNNIKDNNINKGQELIVSNPEKDKKTTDDKKVADQKPTQSKRHTVEKKETLFSISKRYDVSVEDLIKANNLSSSSIKEGQTLIIPGSRKKKDPETSETAGKEVAPEDTLPDKAEEMIREEGIALLSKSEKLGEDFSFCLHKSASPGTVIKIEVPSSGKKVWVRVVGNFSKEENALLKVNPKVMEHLGEEGRTTPVKISYIE